MPHRDDAVSLYAPMLDRVRQVAGIRKTLGAADFALIQKPQVTPTVWVLPLGIEVEPGDVIDTETESYLIVTADRSVHDPTGEKALNQALMVSANIRAVLDGWQPDQCSEPVRYVRGGVENFDDGVIWWADEYVATLTTRSPELQR